MNKYEENVYKNIFEYPTKKIVELELRNEVLEKENQQLKKQKDDVVEFIIRLYKKEHNKTSDWWLQEELCNNFDDMNMFTDFELERMLGEIDE